jgi:hypothetical protein
MIPTVAFALLCDASNHRLLAVRSHRAAIVAHLTSEAACQSATVPWWFPLIPAALMDKDGRMVSEATQLVQPHRWFNLGPILALVP